MNQNIRDLILKNDRLIELNTLIKLGVIKMEDAVVEVIAMGNASRIYAFARDIERAPIVKLADAMIATYNESYIYELAVYMQDKGLLNEELKIKFARAIIKTKSAQFICLYARNIKGAPLKELAEVEIATMNAEYISYFICIEGAPVKKLIKGLVATRDTYYINEVIRNFRYYVYPMIEKVEEIEKEVLAANDVMHYFWHYPQHMIAEIAEVEKEILATNDALFIYDCADKIAGIPVDNFIYKIIELQNFEVIAKMLENVRAGQKSEGQACIEIFALNHINLLLDTMKYCQDINLLRKTYVNVALPSIKNYIGNLISNLEDKSKIEVADVSVLEEEEKLNYLKMLYENGDFETIRKNKEVFSTLFQDEEKITRK